MMMSKNTYMLNDEIVSEISMEITIENKAFNKWLKGPLLYHWTICSKIRGNINI